MDTMHGSQKDSDDSAATPQDETLEEVRSRGLMTVRRDSFQSDLPATGSQSLFFLSLSPADA